MQRQLHTMCPQQVAMVHESCPMNIIKTNPITGTHSLQTPSPIPYQTCGWSITLIKHIFFSKTETITSTTVPLHLLLQSSHPVEQKHLETPEHPNSLTDWVHTMTSPQFSSSKYSLVERLHDWIKCNAAANKEQWIGHVPLSQNSAKALVEWVFPICSLSSNVLLPEPSMEPLAVQTG